MRLLEGQGAMNLREGNTAMYMFILVLNKEECLEPILEAMLEKAGLIPVEVFDELSFEPPKEGSQRLVFVARKPDWEIK